MTYQEVDEAVNAWELRGAPMWATLRDGRLIARVAGSLRTQQDRALHVADAIGVVLSNVQHMALEHPFEADEDHIEVFNLVEDITVHHSGNNDGLPFIVVRMKPTPTTYNWKMRFRVTVEPIVEDGWMDVISE